MADPLILTLDKILPAQRSLVGGKAQRLAALRQSGFPVPDGFVITTAAHALANGTIGQSLHEAISQAYDRLGKAIPLAVRSSASAEDLHDASFAGQYESFLNVIGLPQLIERIYDCWRSLDGERAARYHQQRQRQRGMAVLVQRLVPAHAAGVLFTLNPLTGREHEMVVEASWGLGESVVSGLVSPDRYIIDYYQGRLLDQRIASKQQQVQPQLQGTAILPVERERQEQAVLDQAQLLCLAELGEQIQAQMGEPQDIEWALGPDGLSILQSRPLTALSFSQEEGQWTSANFREVMPGIPTPLSFSLSFEHDYARGLQEFMRKLGVIEQDEDIVSPRLFFGRPYWRIDRLKQLMQLLPGFKERSFDATVGIEPSYEGDGAVTPFTPHTILRGLPILARIWRQHLSFHQTAERMKRDFLACSPALRAVELARLNTRELVDWTRSMIDLRWEINRVVLFCSILSTLAQDDFHAALEPLNARLAPDQQISEGKLLTGLSGISTARPLIALYHMARAALRLPGVAEIFQQTQDPRDLQRRLLESPQASSFWQAFLAGYIERFHYLSDQDEDLAVPRWDEDPALPLALLQRFIRAGLPPDPHQRERERRQLRQAQERQVRRLIWRHPLRVAHLLGLLAIVRRFVWWREGTRDVLGMAHYHCRRALVEQGRRWAGSYLEQPDDIFWLYRAELLRALEGSLSSADARRLVARRRLTARSYRNFTPPAIIGGRGADALMPSAQAATESVLTGIACSPGVVEGPARIIASLDQAGKLCQGEILVAPFTNPGWTPLFSLASAIVMEEGGLLSHGAVVAREYGLPTVLQIRGATTLIADGQRIRVDGGRGIVEVLD